MFEVKGLSVGREVPRLETEPVRLNSRAQGIHVRNLPYETATDHYNYLLFHIIFRKLRSN